MAIAATLKNLSHRKKRKAKGVKDKQIGVGTDFLLVAVARQQVRKVGGTGKKYATVLAFPETVTGA